MWTPPWASGSLSGINEDIDPRVPVLYHATPRKNLESIRARGLLKNKCGSITVCKTGGVFVTDDIGLARHYAEMRFGVDPSEYGNPWVILRLDPAQLDAGKLRPDPGQEAELHTEEIEAAGYTLYSMPWQMSLRFTGQAVYAGDISPSAIQVVETVI